MVKRRSPARPLQRVGRVVRYGTRTGRLPALALAVGLSVLVGGFLTAKTYTVRTVEVRGARLATADEVVQESGALGQSLFWLRPDDVARRITRHPAVIAASVHPIFPDRVIISLQERVPVLVWVAGGQPYLIDGQGWVIAQGDQATLPHVSQADGTPPQLGSKLPTSSVQAASTIVQRTKGQQVSLLYSSKLGLTLIYADGRSVVFGDATRLADQLAVFQALLARDQSWLRLDLRDPDRPVIW